MIALTDINLDLNSAAPTDINSDLDSAALTDINSASMTLAINNLPLQIEGDHQQEVILF